MGETETVKETKADSSVAPRMNVAPGAFELAPRGARKYDWRDPYHVALSLTWPKFIGLFILLDLAINLLFATAYFLQPGSIANAKPGSLADCFFFSMETLATVGYGVMAPATLYAHSIASTEILTGMAFMAIMTGLTFVRFSRPKARILYAKNPVIGRFNGKPTLMIRIANGRATRLTDATARLGALINEWTLEGQFFRRIVDLPLNRSRIPLFGLTWTLRHDIDAASPFFGLDQAKTRELVTRLFLSIEARDPNLAAQVYDVKDYGVDEILYGYCYADAVGIDKDGHTVADLTRISWTDKQADA